MRTPSISGSAFLADAIAHSTKARNIAFYHLRDWAASEDAVQEAMMKMLELAPKDRTREGRMRYFLTVVRNVARNRGRAAMRQRRWEERFAREQMRLARAPEEEMDRRQTEKLVRESIDLLPEPLRETVCLCCEAGFSQRDAAGILGVDHRTIGHRVKKGLERLRRILKKEGITTASTVSLGAWIAEIGPPPSHAFNARLEALVRHYQETGTFPDWARAKKGAGKATSVSARASKRSASRGSLFPVLAASTIIAVVALGVGYGFRQAETGDPGAKKVEQKQEAPREKNWSDSLVLFHDDFEHGSDKWVFKIRRRAEDPWKFRQTGLQGFVEVRRLQMAGRTGGVLVLNAKSLSAKSGGGWAVPRRFVTVTRDFEWAYDICCLGAKNRELSYSIKRMPPVSIRANRWYRVRREFVRLKDGDSRGRWRERLFVDDRPCGVRYSARNFAENSAVVFKMGGITTLIDNVIVREVVSSEPRERED